MLRRTLLMLSLAACSHAHEGRGRPPPDDEVAPGRAPDAGQSAPVATGDSAPDDGGASPSLAPDADPDPSLDPEDVDGRSGVDDPPCSWQRVDVRGESPLGPLQLTEVSVSYWNGFTMGTSLVVRGQAGARAIEIRANVYTLKYAEEAAPVGEYRSAEDSSQSGDMGVYATLCDDTPTHCSGMTTDLRRAQLRVDAHEVPPLLKDDSPVRFEGALRISDPGWSLDLPFALRRACGISVDT